MTVNEKVDLLLEEFRSTIKSGLETGTVNARNLAKRMQQILLVPLDPPGKCLECTGRGWHPGDCHPRETCAACDGTGLDCLLYMDDDDRVAFKPSTLWLPAAKAEQLSDPPGPRESTKADVHYHPADQPAIDRPRGFKHRKLDAGGAELTYGILCRARPDEQPFVVLANRTQWNALSKVFLMCATASETGYVPDSLAWWKDVPFYQSDLAPLDSVLFATRLPLRCEGPFEWAERTWLSILVNIGELPYYQDKAAAEGGMPS